MIVTVLALLVLNSNKILPQRQNLQLPPTITPPVSTTPTTNPKIDYQAGFAIFTNNTFRIFTASMYHNLSEDVYIQADNPNVVYVKNQGIKWDDFFKTLPMQLTKDCLTTGTKQTFCTDEKNSLKFYLNGVRDDLALEKVIQDGDQLLVSFGPDEDPNINQQLTKVPNLD